MCIYKQDHQRMEKKTTNGTETLIGFSLYEIQLDSFHNAAFITHHNGFEIKQSRCD